MCSRSLTQFRGFAENKGVRPEFSDGGTIKTGITHWLSEAAVGEDMKHVESGPNSPYDAVNTQQENRQIWLLTLVF